MGEGRLDMAERRGCFERRGEVTRACGMVLHSIVWCLEPLGEIYGVLRKYLGVLME